LPIDAHLPHEYIAEERLRLEAYRLLASAHTDEDLDAAVEELTDRYGSPPEAVNNLVAVARLRVVAARARLSEVVAAGNFIRLGPVELVESRSLRLTRLYPGSVIKPAVRTILVPRPSTARVGGVPLKDMDLMKWAQDLIESVLLD
jgi:transcription-repair coupling factor (superfamily II helicase)